MRTDRILSLTLCLLSLCAVGRVHGQTLSGITVFTTDMTGTLVAGAAFNTYGGDTIPNVYVINDPVAQTYYNSGDTGGASAPTGISIPLSAGTTEFFASVDPSLATQGMYYGLNLFFDGDSANPGISAFTAINTPAGVANGGMTLANTGGATLVAGANTLTYTDSVGNMVVLTLFNYASTRVAGLPTNYPEDLVGPFSLGPNGTPDNYVDFTLSVIPVPEPSLWALLGVGALGIATLARREKRRRLSALA